MHRIFNSGSSAAALTLIVASALTLAACGKGSPEPASSASANASASSASASASSSSTAPALQKVARLAALLPEKIRSAGVLNVVVSQNYPPFNFFDTDGKTTIGVNADLANALGTLFGVKVNIISAIGSSIIPAMQTGKYDMSIAGFADTAPRRKVVSFVDWAKNSGAFLVESNSKLDPKVISDVCGVKVAANSGTTQAADLAAQAPKCEADGKKPPEVSLFEQPDALILALKSGRIDVVVTTAGSGAYIAKQSDGALKLTASYNDSVPLGIMIEKDDMELAKALEAAVQYLMDTGAYKTMLSKWGLYDFNSLKSSSINDGH